MGAPLGWTRRVGRRADDWTEGALDGAGPPEGWGTGCWIAVKARPGEGKQFSDLAFYRCAGPAATPLPQLIRV
jgi:hypothetical protein